MNISDLNGPKARLLLPHQYPLTFINKTGSFNGKPITYQSINEVADSQELTKQVNYLASVNNFKFSKLIFSENTLHITVVNKGSQPTAKLVQAKVINQKNDMEANGRILVIQK